jgi:hypothetical protein
MNATGEIFIADNTYSKIRKVSTSGIITSVAGNGRSGFSGDGGLATSATFNAINSVAVDDLETYLLQTRIITGLEKVNTSKIVSTVAGNGGGAFSGDGGSAKSAQIYRPSWVSVDGSGNIFISSSFHVRKVTISSGIITSVAGNGTGGYAGDGGSVTKAQFYHPVGISQDRFGNIFWLIGRTTGFVKLTHQEQSQLLQELASPVIMVMEGRRQQHN